MSLRGKHSLWKWLALGAAIVAVLVLARAWRRSPSVPTPGPIFATEGGPNFGGEVFGAPLADPYETPDIRSIALPSWPGATAIWGATGRDADGHIWFGISAMETPDRSAHLVEYVPESGQVFDRGDVTTQLQLSRVGRPGERQMKIHSRIIQGADGHLYFTSMDEEGEHEDGSRLPTWGSHIWRLRLPTHRWEHLLAAPEGLIAIAVAGHRVYGLGYFDHVLYQYDAATSQVRSVHVGSVGGHISRNFFVDPRGHIYVPRLRRGPSAPRRLTATLVELNADLEVVDETPLRHYLGTSLEDCHGIVGFQYLADGSIAFVTHVGYLYRVLPFDSGPGIVAEQGWFHPDGEAYAPTLFSPDGQRYLMGVGRRANPTGARWQWLVHDLQAKSSRAVLLRLPQRFAGTDPDLLLYGSITRDNDGSFYVAGALTSNPPSKPLALQLRWP
jgi:hypothetical protein